MNALLLTTMLASAAINYVPAPSTVTYQVVSNEFEEFNVYEFTGRLYSKQKEYVVYQLDMDACEMRNQYWNLVDENVIFKNRIHVSQNRFTFKKDWHNHRCFLTIKRWTERHGKIIWNSPASYWHNNWYPSNHHHPTSYHVPKNHTRVIVRPNNNKTRVVIRPNNNKRTRVVVRNNNDRTRVVVRPRSNSRVIVRNRGNNGTRVIVKPRTFKKHKKNVASFHKKNKKHKKGNVKIKKYNKMYY